MPYRRIVMCCMHCLYYFDGGIFCSGIDYLIFFSTHVSHEYLSPNLYIFNFYYRNELSQGCQNFFHLTWKLILYYLLTNNYFPQLTAVHLVDAHHCSDPTKFISVLLTSLSTMIHIELPHVNVLSKIDLVEQYGKLGKLIYTCVLKVCS